MPQGTEPAPAPYPLQKPGNWCVYPRQDCAFVLAGEHDAIDIGNENENELELVAIKRAVDHAVLELRRAKLDIRTTTW